MKILLTGGLGYIGSHTAISLLAKGHDLLIYDNLSNSKISALHAIQEIAGKKVRFVDGDILDIQKLTASLKDFNVDTVIHFAGLKAVGESLEQPMNYYEVNVGGSINLLKAMDSLNINRLIFSSSATVYGVPVFLPITEDHPKQTLNPYGRTKFHIENILEDLVASNPDWKISCLRYFNPVGAHKSYLLGEHPNNIPNNIMPRIARAASGLSEKLFIYGNDYNTADGTCERDYIHVNDLAEGHLSALEYLENQSERLEIFNLGTGKSCSVLKLISTFEDVTGKKVPYEISDRREGDVEICFADVTKSRKFLSWSAKNNLEDMCLSAWKFHCLNIAN